MDEASASPDDTYKQPSRAEGLLENGLSEAWRGIADLVSVGRAIDPAADEYGHARSRAYADAVALLKACAKVGHTIAELRGSKFEHNINVRRDAPALPVWGNIQEVVEPPEWGVRQYKGHDYNPNNRFAENKVFVRGLGKMHVPDDWDEERWKAGLPQKWEEASALEASADSNGGAEGGPPPSISAGSNGNFEAPSGGAPRVRTLG